MTSDIIQTDLDRLNARGVDEILASNTYRYGATCFEKMGLMGFAKWCRGESAQELTHRDKLEKFANDLGEELEMESIPGVEFPKETPVGILTYFLKMERDLMEAYEKDSKGASRLVVSRFFSDMALDQVGSVGEIRDMLSELETTGEIGISMMNERLLKG